MSLAFLFAVFFVAILLVVFVEKMDTPQPYGRILQALIVLVAAFAIAARAGWLT